jgi:hypothetical protein
MFITEVLENHEIYYKTQNRHGLSIMQSYIANHHGRLFVTVYQLYSHILQIIATDCSSRFIDMQSYITNHRGRLFVTVYRLCSHILQIIAADCSSQFINYAVIYYKSSRQTVRHALSIIVIHYKLQIIATDCSSRFIDYTVIYYKSSRQTVWQCLSIIQSYITNHRDRLFGNVYQLYSHILQNTNHRGKLFLHVYLFCSLIQLTKYRGMIYIFQSLTKIYEERRLCSTHLRICRPPVF